MNLHADVSVCIHLLRCRRYCLCLRSTFYQFVRHVARLVAVGCMTAEKVGKEKQLQYEEDDKQLDEDNQPQCFAKVHVAKAIDIQVDSTRPEAAFSFLLFTLHVYKYMKYFFLLCQ